jgi:hypothetical protein
MICRKLTEIAEICYRSVSLATRQQPAGTLLDHERNHESKNTSGNKLYSEWGEPLPMRGRQVFGNAKVDPAEKT